MMRLQIPANKNNWRYISYILLGILGIVIIGYVLWQLRSVWRGPTITIDTPTPGMTVTENPIRIKGSTDQVYRLSINGTHIPLQTTGDFDYTTAIGPGFSTIEISISDTHERRLKRISIPVFFQTPTTTPDSTSAPEQADNIDNQSSSTTPAAQ